MTTRATHTLHSLQEMLATVPADALVVGLYIHSTEVSQDEWLNPLARRLQDAGFVTIGLCTPQSVGKCRLDAASTLAVLEPEEVQHLERINVFIISESDSLNIRYPATAKILGCLRAFEKALDTSLPFQVPLAALLDGLLISFPLSERSRTLIAELWTGFTNPAVTRRGATPFHIIPVGYPRMGVLAEQLRQTTDKAEAIVYAPIAMKTNPELEGNRLKKHGGRIIRVLLSSFPGRTVIFRPYKSDLGSDEVRDIRAAFENEERFVLDAEDSRLSSFARGALLVTDLSHIAKSFSFATLRPAIYFRPWDKNAKKYAEWAGGWTTWTYSGLVEACRLGLEGGDALRERIRHKRDSLVMPFETALDDIAGLIRDFYEDRPRDPWLTIPRDSSVPVQGERQILRTIARHYAPALPFTAAAAAVFNNQDSPLLAACALHCGLVMTPDTALHLSPDLRKTLAVLLNREDFSCPRYRDIDPEDVRQLYSRAMLAMLRHHDRDGAIIAESLLRHFNEFCQGTATEELAALPFLISKERRLLSLKGLSRVLHDLPHDAFVVGLYINIRYGAQDEWLNALAPALRARGMVTVGLLTPKSIPHCDLSAADHVAVVPPEAVVSLERIQVFVISDMDNGTCFPASSRILGCAHSFFHTSLTCHFSNCIWVSALLDGFMVPVRLSRETREATASLWTGFIHPSWSRRGPKPFHLIPVGYPRLAAMVRTMREVREKPDALVYAPVALSHEPHIGGERVRTYGLRTIQYLLEHFPDHTVIFRPTPSDMNQETVRDIIAFFRDEPRFILDDHDDQIFAFSRAATVITDLSHVVNSFAFSMLRPGIYFRPWEEGESTCAPWDGGFSSTTWEGLHEAVTLAIDKADEEKERIRANRERTIMPLDSALDEIAGWIRDFYAGRPRPQWLTIERADPTHVRTETNIIRQVRNVPAHTIHHAMTVAAVFRNPHSPLLAAYALHAGMEHCPGTTLNWGLHTVVNNLLGKNVYSCDPYKAVSAAHVRQLYERALDEYRARNDTGAVALVEELLRDFRLLYPEKAAKPAAAGQQSSGDGREDIQ